jgi:energy-coupling factor transporter ATP-binding protein EcfA2
MSRLSVEAGYGYRAVMYLRQVRLANVRGFHAPEEPISLDFRRPDGEYAGWTVMAGRNGSGKSTLLRALALTLAGPTTARSLVSSFGGWINNFEQQAYVHIAFTVGHHDFWGLGGAPPKRQPWAGLRWTANPDGPEPTLVEDLPANAPKQSPRRGPWYENPTGWFLAGYGPLRRLTGAAAEAQRLMLGHKRVASLVTLFDESASLAESTWWLQDIYPRSLEGDTAAEELLEDVLALLNDGLLPEQFKVLRYDSKGLWVKRGDLELVLEEMSDGYRTMAALVLDLLRRMHQAFGSLDIERNSDGVVTCNREGVVLIDEVDVHLHVSWQQRIGFWMQRHFPRLQFIVSTHSPFICQAASPRGLLRLPAPDEMDRSPRFLPEVEAERIINGGADQAIISELFGLETPFSHQSERLRQELRTLQVDMVEDGALTDEDLERYNHLALILRRGPSDEVSAALQELLRRLPSRQRA